MVAPLQELKSLGEIKKVAPRFGRHVSWQSRRLLSCCGDDHGQRGGLEAAPEFEKHYGSEVLMHASVMRSLRPDTTKAAGKHLDGRHRSLSMVYARAIEFRATAGERSTRCPELKRVQSRTGELANAFLDLSEINSICPYHEENEKTSNVDVITAVDESVCTRSKIL
ncbi:hypothetical protein EVAR_57798_1 [Eumeta japonica]|uniref:Uncharacterized protein n=1 Tax=Eumeta variegata TaxID=151549 RepID=A0A4C1Y6A2_EUMVA|nr:hypothetical protein EVAR_57798_1 [Eumeta japonica]